MRIVEAGPTGPALGDAAPRYVFVTGLHRSGTSLLAHLIGGALPEAARLQDTGVDEDEGQLLQHVIPRGSRLGGPGRFALHPRAALDEGQAQEPRQLRSSLERDWRPWWDAPDAALRIEKSPPTIVRTRWFQRVFPGSCFIVIVRDPVAVAMATMKWTSRWPSSALLLNWAAAHRRLTADLPLLERVHVLRYEDLVQDPDGQVRGALTGVGLPAGGRVPVLAIDPSSNDRYHSLWASRRRQPLERALRPAVRTFVEPVARRYGYTGGC